MPELQASQLQSCTRPLMYIMTCQVWKLPRARKDMLPHIFGERTAAQVEVLQLWACCECSVRSSRYVDLLRQLPAQACQVTVVLQQGQQLDVAGLIHAVCKQLQVLPLWQPFEGCPVDPAAAAQLQLLQRAQARKGGKLAVQHRPQPQVGELGQLQEL